MKNAPPSVVSFRRPRGSPRRPPFRDDQLCRASALSLYADIDDVGVARELIPGFRKKLVARGVLGPTQGVLQSNPTRLSSSHTSWFSPADTTFEGLFPVSPVT